PGVHPPDAGDGPRLLGEQVLDAAVVLLVAPSLALEHEREGRVLVDQDARERIHHVEDAEGRHRRGMLCPATGRGKVSRGSGPETRGGKAGRGAASRSSLLSTVEHPRVGHPAQQTTSPGGAAAETRAARWYVVRWGLRRGE